ncbi:MAG TPA: methylenetetrahydrofolate reductase C-terminal domain-containing protein [Dehalococcoidales bacterium]|nr:methylenetetrahydrofolate reductase C-terminal domain-containing protein [Dehalococcoidales bacterium]
MILSEQKPFEEIADYLEGEKSVFILGCNGCAQSSGSGGPVQVEEMRKKLEEAGKKVTGTKVIDFLCEKALVKSGLRGKVDQVAAADSILVMTCGIGVQAVAASVNKVCHPACNTVNLGGSRGEWKGSERCKECGQCLLDYTGGICPLTACTKSLVSGACGGASNGKCELSPDRDCGWELIYNRLKSKNQLAKLMIAIDPLDHGKLMARPEMMSTSRYALENHDQEVKVK